jgi:hypothetical protein
VIAGRRHGLEPVAAGGRAAFGGGFAQLGELAADTGVGEGLVRQMKSITAS